MSEKKQSSGMKILGCIGIGCLVVVVVTVLVVVGGGYLAVRKAKRFAEEVKDPVARTERTLEALHSEQLPEGYEAIGAFSIPFLLDVAMISDRAPDEEGNISGDDPEGRLFIYLNVLNIGSKQQELRDFFEGKRSSTDVMDNVDVDFRRGDLIARGQIEGNDEPWPWIASRGEVSLKDGRPFDAIISMVLVDCPQDDRIRLGLWFVPDPHAATPLEDATYAGTPADGQVIEEFLGHFGLCGG